MALPHMGMGRLTRGRSSFDSAAMTTNTVTLDGVDIWYEDSGADGDPVLLLHAGGADASMWDGVLAELSERSDPVRTIRFDFPGSGRSTGPQEPVGLVDLTIHLLDHLAVETVTVAGVSMGGTIALDLAAEHLERVSSLLVMSAAGHDHLATEGPTYPGVGVFQALATGDRATAVERYLDLWCSSTATPETDPEVRRLVEENIDSILLTLTGRTLLPTWPSDERLPQVRVPVGLAYGLDDDPALLRSARRLETSLPDSELVLLEGTDHFVPVRRPAQTADLLAALRSRVAVHDGVGLR
jgi:pimeloyl-ACP methyl ester carboxylesterase